MSEERIVKKALNKEKRDRYGDNTSGKMSHRRKVTGRNCGAGVVGRQRLVVGRPHKASGRNSSERNLMNIGQKLLGTAKPIM
jgi:hypothetical protein